MDLLSLKVKDVSTGNVYGYSFKPNENCILETHFCTSYFHFEIQIAELQEDGKIKYRMKTLICPFEKANPIDLMCINEGELGEIVQ